MTFLLRSIREAFRRYTADDGGLMAAAVAYYATLSFFPLLLLLIAGVGFLARSTTFAEGAEREVLRILETYSAPQLASQVSAALARIERDAVFSARLGAIGLLITASGLFFQFEKAFDRIWNIERPQGQGLLRAIKASLVDRLQAFLGLLAIGSVLVVTWLANLALTAAQRWSALVLPRMEAAWTLAQFLVTLLLTTAAFTLTYRYLPKVPVTWSAATRGALFAALMWELGRSILAAILVGPKSSMYGVIGSVLAIMLWAYFASTVVFLGAELVQIFCGYEQGARLEPKANLARKNTRAD